MASRHPGMKSGEPPKPTPGRNHAVLDSRGSVPIDGRMKVPSHPALRAAGWLLLLAGTALRAELAWDTRVVEHTAALGEENVKLAFAFANTTTRTITITDVETSCGCTAATLAKKTYAPGERGRLDVIFDAKGTAGPQQKTIYVRTDDAPESIALTLRVNVPVWLEIAPRLLWWKTGEKPAAKEALITVTEPARIKLTAATVDSEAFTARLLPRADGRTTQLLVTPAAVTAPSTATITVTAELAGGERRTYVVFAQVR